MRRSLVDRASVERLLLLSGAIRSGLIDQLARDGAQSAEEVAGGAGVDLRATRMVLEALVVEGVVDRRPPVAGPLYELSALGRAHLVTEGPDLERSGILHLANRVRGWLDLPEVISTGRPLQRDEARRDIRSFASAMGEREPEFIVEILRRCLEYSGEIHTMIDIGGAVGHVARQFSRSGVRATLLDREGVIPIAREFLGGEVKNIDIVEGDFTHSLPSGPFDLAYLGNILHIYGPEIDARLIKEVFGVLTPGGTIAVQDHVWGRSPRAAMFAVNMLQATEAGGVWTEEQYRGWLRDAGFEDLRVYDLDATESQLILGRKPRLESGSVL